MTKNFAWIFSDTVYINWHCYTFGERNVVWWK